MYKLFVAFRYLRRNWLNFMGALAVALAVLAPICVLSVMKGFDEEFRARTRATLSDLMIEGRSDEPFSGYEAPGTDGKKKVVGYEEMIARIEKLPHVKACAPEYSGLGLVKLEKGLEKRSRYVEFHGVDLARESRATDFADFWRAWRGRRARQELAGISAGGAGMESALKSEIAQLLAVMRHEDFSLMESADRKAILSWAKRKQVDLDAALSAGDAALPEWGPPGENAMISPAFAGEELLILGQDPTTGRVDSMDVGEGKVTLIAPTDVFDRSFRRCRIVGGFRSGISEYDLRTIYLPLADVQEFMDQPKKITSINIRLDSFDHAPEVRAWLLGILTPEEIGQGIEVLRPLLRRDDPAKLADLDRQYNQLCARLPKWFAEGSSLALTETVALERILYEESTRFLDHPEMTPDNPQRAKVQKLRDQLIEREKNGFGRYRQFSVHTWEFKRRIFLQAVALERHVLAFILFFVGLIAGTLILALLHTTVISKTRDIGTLKAVGGSARGIMSIFLLNGLLMGLVGSAVGTLGGFLITDNINAIESVLSRWIGISLFPSDIYYLDKIPVDQHPWPSILVICAMAILLSLAASIYPAWKAARMDAVEALRYE